MFCKKYEKDFHENELSSYFSSHILGMLDDFIERELLHGYEFINPYKFSHIHNINIENSIKLFLFFTGEDKLFLAKPFIDCPRCPGKRLPISIEYPIDEQFIFCDDCMNEYQIEYFKKHIYFYFRLHNHLRENIADNQYDPNSTYDIYKRLNDPLKVESPSYFSEESESNNTGGDVEKGVSLKLLNDYNEYTNGKPISVPIKEMNNKLMSLLISE